MRSTTLSDKAAESVLMTHLQHIGVITKGEGDSKRLECHDLPRTAAKIRALGESKVNSNPTSKPSAADAYRQRIAAEYRSMPAGPARREFRQKHAATLKNAGAIQTIR